MKRLMRTRGMTEADARSRIAAQASDEQRRAAADVWIANDGRQDDLLAAVDELWESRLVPFEQNVRLGRRAPRPGGPELVPSDPTWPAQAARLLARLSLAFGDLAVTADHIGSTAVPGLAAKDVIDLQVGVRSLSDADDQALVDRLAAAGFPRPTATAEDRSKDGTPWPKRFHGSSDPGRATNVHVRQVGSPGWRWALMFRDWMRAVPEAREEYAAEKLRLADGAATREEYADAKEPWFDAVHDRVEDWASRTGWEPAGG